MTNIAASNFKRDVNKIVGSLCKRKKEVLITDHGKLLALLIPVNKENIEDFILSTHPAFQRMREKSRKQIKSGDYVGEEELLSMK